MLKKLHLKRFKNFKDAHLELGPLTVLVGANASGKSNIRDAFRFLHGIARGYTLAEIMGEKYIDGGVLQWRGIRGGPREIAYLGADSFALTVEIETYTYGEQVSLFPMNMRYSIEIDPGNTQRRASVVKESLYFGEEMVFDSHPDKDPPRQMDKQHITIKFPMRGIKRRALTEAFIAHQPVLTQFIETIVEKRGEPPADISVGVVKKTISALNSMRFLELDPDAMQTPSLPGQTILGDRGENLSSVLQAICENPTEKKALVEWIKELTPMDARDFEFISDQTGKILISLLEESGQVTSAYSASDGTLRFLAMIAALLGPNPAKFYFFEELDNGLHPTRLHLLLQLVERRTNEGQIQMVATSHAPQLLRALGKRAIENASLVYRFPDSPEARIKRIVDMPEIREILERQDLARLHESGWFEDAMYFSEDVEGVG